MRISIFILSTLVLFAGLPQRGLAACDLSGLPEGTPVVEMVTTLGSVCLEMLPQYSPLTVENFLWYQQNGQIDGTFYHRAEPGFVLQGGGFLPGTGAHFARVPIRVEIDEGTGQPYEYTVPFEPCNADIPDPIEGDPNHKKCSVNGNERGTVALAKASSPDDGSTNWFFNLTDNRSNLDQWPSFLDPDIGGFTVFARVMGDGMEIVDAIAALGTFGNNHFPDVAYWADPLVFSQFFRPPLVNSVRFEPGRLPGDPPLFGCWDPQVQGLIMNPDDPAVQAKDVDQLDTTLYPLEVDPVHQILPFLTSAACGTPTTVETFVANPGTAECPDADRLSLQVPGPSVLAPDFEKAYSYTCEQMETALTWREAWRVDLYGRYIEQLVYIDSTSLTVVPEPGTALLQGGTLLALGMLRRWRSSPLIDAEQGSVGRGAAR